MAEPNAFVFVFPYRGVGGVSVLFSRLATRLAAKGIPVAVVDYPDGAMPMGRPEGVALIPYREQDDVLLPETGVIVFQAMTPWSLFPALRVPGRARLFFWNCHPFNLVPTMPGLRAPMQSNLTIGRALLRTLLRSYRDRMIRFTRFLLDSEALVFMDRPNVLNTERYLEMSISKPEFLPIFAGDPIAAPISGARNFRRDGLRLCWIGRIADFKIHILRRTLTDLDALQPKLSVPVSFAIVGSGPHERGLRAEAARWRNLRVEFRGDVPIHAVAPLLQDEVDILFAMGTSALEGASAGVPVVLLDVAYGPVAPGYRYSWLYERDGYTLGDVLAASKPAPANDSLFDRLVAFMLDPEKHRQRTLQYYAENHAPGAAVERFLEQTRRARCYYSDYAAAGFARRDPVYEAFASMRGTLFRR